MTENHTYQHNELFELETGGFLPGFQLRYTTLGKLNPEKSNVVWVCHALTGNSDVFDWWGGLFQPKAVFDPEEYFIVCANTLGGCYGSTGPLSINPATQKPFYYDFPEITNRDIARAFDLLRVHLEIPKIEILLGGSLGGQHAIEWAVTYPDNIGHLIAVATNAVHSPWGIGFNESQRMAIENDPTWKNNEATAGINGMKTARSFALLSYRNYGIYKDSQDDTRDEKTDDYRASSYQRYQGEKLAKRFNAFTYWYLSKAMDSHHVGRQRGE